MKYYVTFYRFIWSKQCTEKKKRAIKTLFPTNNKEAYV